MQIPWTYPSGFVLEAVMPHGLEVEKLKSPDPEKVSLQPAICIVHVNGQFVGSVLPKMVSTFKSVCSAAAPDEKLNSMSDWGVPGERD
jgi:hypothetical protein